MKKKAAASVKRSSVAKKHPVRSADVRLAKKSSRLRQTRQFIETAQDYDEIAPSRRPTQLESNASKASHRTKKESGAQDDRARALTQIPAVRQAIEEEAVARTYVLARYHTLINRKYLEGLSSQENEELDGLQATLDNMDEPFYDGIIKRLRTLVERALSPKWHTLPVGVKFPK